jgi:8-hydroxy-5-deazaflavin:NADPH oxidoreductase
MTQTIGIIGSGMIGGQLARLSVAAGFDVILSNSRSPDSITDLVRELGERGRAATPPDAARASDLVVAAIPFGVYTKLPAEALVGKIVIDTMNYYPERDGIMREEKTDTISTSELVQRHLSESYVVKAFNNMDYIRLFACARPKGSRERSAVPVAGDNVEAKTVVMQFIDTIGYDAVDMGRLADSWRSEPTTPVYVFPYIVKSQGRLTPEEADSYFMQAPGAVVTSEQVKALLAKAVRHDKMAGFMAAFRESL